MKTKNLWKWSLGACLAVLPFLGCGQRTSTNPPPVAFANEPVAIAPLPVSATDTNVAPPPDVAEQNLETAPVSVVSSIKPPTNSISPAAAEIVKLAQAGVDENVMLAYITNSSRVFNLNSDDLVYLKDVGVPPSVVTAMIQRDQSGNGAAATASAPQAYTNQLVPTPGAPTPYPTTPAVPEPQVESTTVVEAPLTPSANVSYTYFYDSLSPYGSWIDVEGYGRCWQPTVVVVNRGWQPYCDSGHWVYSDCGWYWASDYSWGWAPFHYGRWFHHSRVGWCWAPDTIWAPAWVSWRYTSDYCGWAPLPPTACYRPGIGFTYYGRSVDVSFSFGLSARHYAFVPIRNFNDRHPYRYRVPQHNVTQIYNTTVVVNNYSHGGRDRIINHGIPVDRVRTVTRTDIRPVQLHDTDRPSDARVIRSQDSGTRSLTVYHPQLPQPDRTPTRLVGEGVRPATRTGFTRDQNTRTIGTHNSTLPPAAQPSATTSGNSIGNGNLPAANSGPNRATVKTDRDNRNDRNDRIDRNDRRNDNAPAPTAVNPAPTTVTPDSQTRTTSGDNRTREPIIIRGPGRSQSSDNNNAPTTRAWTTPSRTDANPSPRVIQPATPAQPAVPTIAPATPATPASPTRNDSGRPPTRQFSTPVTPSIPSVPAQPSAPQHNDRVFRQDTPRFQRQEQFTTPSVPVQRQEAPSFQTPRAAESQSPRYSPPVERPSRSERAVVPESRPSRQESQPARPSNSGGGGNNSRSSRSDSGNDNRRGR
jgi:hypothetical protein